MGILFESKKRRPSPTKRIPLLPRFGFYLDVFGREFTFKQVPVLETAINLIKSGVTLSNLKKITKRQFDEVSFIKAPKEKTVNTTAKTIRQKQISK